MSQYYRFVCFFIIWAFRFMIYIYIYDEYALFIKWVFGFMFFPHICVFCIFFFQCAWTVTTLFRQINSLCRRQSTLFIHCLRTVHEYHGIIHPFKNYFVTVFSVFNKINYIQMDPKLFNLLYCYMIIYYISLHIINFKKKKIWN